MPGTRKSYNSYPLSPQAIDELRSDLNAERGNPKVWQALFNETGTVIPSPTVLTNTLPGTVIWSRAAAGSYNGSYNGSIFIAAKTHITPSGFALISTTLDPTIRFSIVNSQRIMAEVQNTAGSFSEPVISNFPVKIEIFD